MVDALEPALLPSRIQMAFTLATHVLLVPFGVAMPSLTLLMEGIGIWRRDPVALKIARRWSVVMAVQFAVGAVTGTILSFEFGILWPRLMGVFGPAIGLGFAIEGLAFFLEAIFIGIYLYGWDRLPARLHFLLGLVLPPAGVLGAAAVLSSNSWMNTPGGYTLKDGKVTDVDLWSALFPRALGYEFWHFMLALYLTAGFVVASVYAVAWLRGRRDHYQRLAFAVPFTVAAVLTVPQLVIGDLSARALADDQPAKFAAMEVTWQTRDHNPEVVGGFMDDKGNVYLGVPIPSLNSFLVGYTLNQKVRGLSNFKADARPNTVEVNITHLAFDTMVGLGTIGAALSVWYLWIVLRRRRLPDQRLFYRLAAAAGVGSYVTVELGWITTEVGRQPWIVYNVMRVSDAVTTAPASFIWSMLAALVVTYALIAFFFVTLLLRLSARWKRDDAQSPEIGVPYGPRA
jgi:cytochrome bd ubiquinol oxidase subunit I